MGTNTLETAYSNGEVIDASHINELTSSVVNQFVGRNTSGVPEAGKSLGTAALPWGTGYMSTLILNGSAVDASQITSVSNRIISGAERTDSGQPKFITPDGTLATMTLNGATTNLVASINGVTTTVSTDIVKTSLTTAPVVTNAVLVNDTTIISDKFAGENDYYYDRANGKKGYITLDTAGANVTSEVGQMVALKGTTEIMFGHLESATKITNVNRGFFFDSSGSPIVREALSNNDTLTIMSVGWVFVEDNGTTVDVSYLTPFWGFASPGSPATGQYWFDITNQTWKRYSGTEFVIINRIPVGIVVIDGTACIASRSFDFANSFSDANNVEVTINSTEIIESISLNNKFNVYGSSVVQDATKIQWNITTDLESGVVEASSTMYYLYISDEGESVIGDERPLLRSDLGGHYHPYHNWRCLGAAYNDGSSDLTM
ncbi:MAG: hypothetical protein KAI25_02235, partial [Hyphomicrobiaceae bacterium]|nr:hypothetical protein [Hyphomicrobiaceae bacterium]